tara:strand:- start:1063 stop:1347 length:285 start_codon:yes stop_codon:yes gene_type:complete
MKKLLEVSLSVLLFTFIFSFNSSSEAKTLRELQMEEAERCNKSIFSKIKCKTGEYNLSPTDYFKKRKKCSNLRDRADTVYQGKQLYKQCMDRYR